jgi:hypothetical protein
MDAGEVKPAFKMPYRICPPQKTCIPGRKTTDTSVLRFFSIWGGVAGLAMFDIKKSIEATTPIATAFKLCIRHRKK